MWIYVLIFSNQKTVEFTFEKRRGEIERRVYSFDTKQDQKVRINRIWDILEWIME